MAWYISFEKSDKPFKLGIDIQNGVPLNEPTKVIIDDFPYLKPKKMDFTPRLKKKGKTQIARKKIIKQVARKEFVEQAKEAQKLLNLPEAQNTKKQSFGVLDRFVPTVKTRK